MSHGRIFIKWAIVVANPSIISAENGFEFSDQDFNRVRQLIYERAGISLSSSKRQMVYSRLGRRLRVLGFKSFADYLSLLDTNDEAEWEAFTNALTTNLTSFFREAHHFPILAEHVASIGRSRSSILWCCAASTGEEPYSMAMTLAESFGTLHPPIRILATDLDTNVLAKAQRGVYAGETLVKLAPELVRKYFLRGKGENAGYFKVRPELQSLITFRQINLLDDVWPLRGPLDAIFCRNVMIYFDHPTQYGLLKRFAPLLRSDGLLFVGHSESLQHAGDIFRLRGKTVYRLARSGDGHHAS